MIEDSCVKNAYMRNSFVLNADDLIECCFTDAGTIKEAFFRDVNAIENIGFRDVCTLNCFRIHLQSSWIFQFKQYSSALEVKVRASQIKRYIIGLNIKLREIDSD